MRSSVGRRLALSYVVVSLLGVGATTALSLFLLEELSDSRRRSALAVEANAIADQLEPVLALEMPPVVLDDIAGAAALVVDARVRILDGESRILADSGLPGRREARLLLGGPDPALTELESEYEVRQARPVAPRAVHLQVLPDRDAAYTPASDIATIARPLRRGDEVEGAEIYLQWRSRSSEAALPSDLLAILPRSADDQGAWVAKESLAIRQSAPSSEDEQAELGGVVGRMIVVDPESDEPLELAELAEPANMTSRSTSSWQAVDSPLAESSALIARAAIGAPGTDPVFVELSQPSPDSPFLTWARWSLGMAGLGAVLAAGLAGAWMGRRISAPLRELAQTAATMRAGDLSARAAIRGDDEIAQLGERLNSMAEELEANFEALAAERDALRRFVADASHELRTPITALSNFNSLLRDGGELDDATRRDYLAEEAQQIQRLEGITAQLLDLSRLDGGLVELDLETVDLRDIVREAGRAMRAPAKARGIELVAELPDLAAEARVDAGRLRSALDNLIDNALKYGPADAVVRIGLSQGASSTRRKEASSQGWELWVEDTGPGLESVEAQQLFGRFRRGKAADGIPGSGLGLAICEGIARAHGGAVWASSSDAGGSRFVIGLPED